MDHSVRPRTSLSGSEQQQSVSGVYETGSSERRLLRIRGKAPGVAATSRHGLSGIAGSCLSSPRVCGCSTDQIPTNDSEGDLIGTFEVFHEYPLEFEGYLLSCAKMPGAKKSDPD